MYYSLPCILSELLLCYLHFLGRHFLKWFLIWFCIETSGPGFLSSLYVNLKNATQHWEGRDRWFGTFQNKKLITERLFYLYFWRMEHMALIAVSAVTVTTLMGVILSPGTAAALQAGQVKSAIPFGNLGALVDLGVLLICFALLLLQL